MNAEPARRASEADRVPEDRSDGSPRTAPDRVRDRGERVRRRELDTALRRLAAATDGEVTPAERRILARLSARLADALVERWAATLDDDAVDADAALTLLTERTERDRTEEERATGDPAEHVRGDG